MNRAEIEKKWKEIEKKLQESTENLYGKKGFEPESDPLHNKATVETGKEGVTNAPDEFDAGAKMDTKTENKTKEGASNAETEFEGSKKAAGEDGNDAKEGATGGADEAKKYHKVSFKNKVRGIYGLPVDDKLNKPNKGLNESYVDPADARAIRAANAAERYNAAADRFQRVSQVAPSTPITPKSDGSIQTQKDNELPSNPSPRLKKWIDSASTIYAAAKANPNDKEAIEDLKQIVELLPNFIYKIPGINKEEVDVLIKGQPK
jgi:hypothetical protein